MKIGAIILGAGQGTRMKSEIPKVMHQVGFLPMIDYPVEASLNLGCSPVVVVVGYKKEMVEAHLREKYGSGVVFAYQEEQLGTADAVRRGEPLLRDVDSVLILYGDVPLIREELLKRLIEIHKAHTPLISMVVSEVDDPKGYGRIIRDEAGMIVAIREDKDCSEKERKIKEINPGIYVIDKEFLYSNLSRIDNLNMQREFYLTDLIEIASKESEIKWIKEDFAYLLGVNTRVELEIANKVIFRRNCERWMEKGVTILDRDSVLLSSEILDIGKDTVIEPNVTIKGKSKIGKNVYIERGAIIEDSTVEDNVRIRAYSIIEESHIKEGAQIGPFARLRPKSVVGVKAKVGNFVELKKTILGDGSKANHLSYLGDGIIGKNVNIGAGTIFCNYDGFGKYQTILEDEVFVGSDSQLVAPVKIGKGTYIGTGSTVTEDAPSDSLVIARARQVTKEGYAKRLKERLKKRAGK